MLKNFRNWLFDNKANAALEAGLLFPVMVTILCGMIDLGIGLVTNQKVLNASQIVGDLLARQDDISNGEMADAIEAGRLSLMPYSTTSFGVDAAGVKFIGVTKVPTVQWRDTVNMSPNTAITTGSAGLGKENEGVIAVTVKYTFEPLFTSFVTGDINIQEVAYVRGRKGFFVTRS